MSSESKKESFSGKVKVVIVIFISELVFSELLLLVSCWVLSSDIILVVVLSYKRPAAIHVFFTKFIQEKFKGFAQRT